MNLSKINNKGIKSVLLSALVVSILSACNSGGASTGSSSSNSQAYGIGTDGQVYVSKDGNGWVKPELAGVESSNKIMSLKCGSDICAMASTNGLLVSNDFSNWSNTADVNSNTNLKISAVLYDVLVTSEKNNSVVVAVGQNGSIETVSLSTDNLKSNKMSLQAKASLKKVNPVTENLYSASNVNGKYLVLGAHGTFLQSLDNATTWAPVVTGITNDLYSMYCNAESLTTCIAVGSGGVALTIKDEGVKNGLSVKSNIIGNDTLYAATYLNSQARFVVAGSNATIKYSDDNGNTWMNADIPTTINGKAYDIYNVVYNGTELVANTAVHSDIDQKTEYLNQFLISQDGKNWTINTLEEKGQITKDGESTGTFASIGGLFGGVFDKDDSTIWKDKGTKIGHLIDQITSVAKLVFAFF